MGPDTYLASHTGRTKAYYLREIIEQGLAELEDYEYTKTAKGQLRKLHKATARRILDFLDERIAGREDPRRTGKALTGPLGGLWRYRVGDRLRTGYSALPAPQSPSYHGVLEGSLGSELAASLHQNLWLPDERV
ncbi:type II toxin-antitoxin system RelE/ParE family toxin [Acidithiobacillus sp. AC3]